MCVSMNEETNFRYIQNTLLLDHEELVITIS
jgi:hypothetical protein